jgi:hypothetical protein
MGERGELWGGDSCWPTIAAFAARAIEARRTLGGAQAMRSRGAMRTRTSTTRWEALHFAPAIRTLGSRASSSAESRALDAMLATGVGSPRASSCGRLFDAVAAAINFCRERVSYEGEAAIELEALARFMGATIRIRLSVRALRRRHRSRVLDPGPCGGAARRSLARVARRVIAARFHRGLAQPIVARRSSVTRADARRRRSPHRWSVPEPHPARGRERRSADVGLQRSHAPQVPAGDGGSRWVKRRLPRHVRSAGIAMCVGIPAGSSTSSIPRQRRVVSVAGVKRRIDISCVVDDRIRPRRA